MRCCGSDQVEQTRESHVAKLRCCINTAMTLSLAPETWDVIIDHLHSDKYALSACALVHKAWTNSARYHLFQHTIIDFETDDLEEISQVFPISGGGVVPYVRKLRILDDLGDTLPSESSVTMLPRFPSIRSMWLRYLIYGPALDKTLSWVMSQLSNVETLKVSISSCDMDQVLALISAAPSLKSLAFENIGLDFNPCSPQQLAKAFSSYIPPSINHLALAFAIFHTGSGYSNNTPVRIMEWMKFHRLHETVWTFCASYLNAQSLPALNICLDIVGSHIEHLRLRWNSYSAKESSEFIFAY